MNQSDAIMEEAVSSQRIAQELGSAMMAHKILMWATKHLQVIPVEAFKDLMAILKDDA